jgi:diguanylate cyclase (GGDEF)-like protein
MISIRKIVLISFAVLMFVIIVAGLIMMSYVFDAFEEKQNADLNIHATTVAKVISLQIELKQSVLKKLLKDKNLINHIEGFSQAEITNKTTYVRKLFPDTVGLAFFDNKGVILGNPKTQNVLLLCQQDMKKHVNKVSEFQSPPIHRPAKRTAHFDLSSTFTSNSSQYYLLVSFRLNILENILEKFGEQNYYYQIVGENNNSITEKGYKGQSLNTQVTIPSTQWQLKVEAPTSGLLDILKYPKRYFVFVFVLLFFSALVITKIVRKYIRREFKTLHGIINSIEQTNEIKTVPVKLSDFGKLQNDIYNQAKELQRSRKELAQLSHLDPLTSMNNRRSMDLDLKKYKNLVERGSSICLAMIDLNNFKLVNDKLGHQIGDTLLIDIANILKESVRNSDGLYRIGGDEFLVALVNSDLEQSQIWKKHLLQKIRMLVVSNQKISQLEYPVGVSVGIIKCENEAIEKTLERADEAMYQDKQEQKGNVQKSVSFR